MEQQVKIPPIATMGSLNALVDAQLSIEKLRVQCQVRQSHLALQGREDKETANLFERVHGLEDYVDVRIAGIITSHPDFPWFSRVKGVGKENIGKIVGLVDINRAPTISSLWKFAGYSVESGKAPKRAKGEKLTYNSQLRSMCWRLGTSLMKAGGKFYGYYSSEKQAYIDRYESAGIKIVPATSLPKVKGKRTETENIISQGHVHNQALRKMIKLFLACLWLTWREAEGLPMTNPYTIDQLKHGHMIDPWSMVDR